MQTYTWTTHQGSFFRTARAHVTASVCGKRTLSRGQTPLCLRKQHNSTLSTSKPQDSSSSNTHGNLSRRTLQAIPTTTLVRSLVVLSATALPAKLLAFLIRMTKKHINIIESVGPLRWIFRRMLYDNFCIGFRKDEISTKIRELRRIGFTGIVLANAREAQPIADTTIGSVIGDAQCEEWFENNLESVQQAEPGDYVGLRFTGAGTAAAKFLSDFSTACKSHSLKEAIKAYSVEMEYYISQVSRICAEAEKRHVRVLIDAESSTYQRAIDYAALVSFTSDRICQFADRSYSKSWPASIPRPEL
jgi:proline dehydrogenase